MFLSDLEGADYFGLPKGWLLSNLCGTVSLNLSSARF